MRATPAPLTPDEVEIVLVELRGGATVATGGSRCNTTYGHAKGRYYAVDFDEGHETERLLTEADLRRVIDQEPDAFRPLVRRPHLRAFRAAYDVGERLVAREHLLAAAEIGDPHRQFAVFAAALGWPHHVPDQTLTASIREKLADVTAWHAFFEPLGWERTPARGREGVAFVDTLLEIAPEPRGYEVRGSFHELAGALPEAVADVQRAVASAPEGAWWLPGAVERLEKLKTKLAGG